MSPLLSPNPDDALSYTKTMNLRALAERRHRRGLRPGPAGVLEAVEGGRSDVRWERFDADATTQTALTGATAAGPVRSAPTTWCRGRAGLIWQPTDTPVVLRLVRATPTTRRASSASTAGTAQTNLNAVNQNLDPEENRNYEIGTQSGTVAQGMQLRTAIFRTEKINQRINNSITGVTELAGKRRVDGIEIELTGTITPNWDIYRGRRLHGRQDRQRPP